MVLRMTMLGLLAMVLAGCGGSSEPSLDAFQEKWFDAVNKKKAEELYYLLDAKGRRQIDVQLETLRGLDPQTQRSVIDQLGGDRVSNLHELSNDRFFALLWRKATDDQPPTMKIEAQGGQGAYMTLTLKDQSQRIELKVEGGRWVWSLPEKKFDVTPKEKK